jgi:hypothetical protein
VKVTSAVCIACGARITWQEGDSAEEVILIGIQHRVDAHGEDADTLIDQVLLNVIPTERMPRA